MKTKRFEPGTKVRMTGKHLASTGQVKGSAGMNRWIVQACDCLQCAEGRWVCTNEPSSYPEIPWRHVAVANLERVK